MSERLQDQVAIVTGGSRGIGRAIAERFAAEGAKVVIASPDPTRGEQAADDIRTSGGAALHVPADVADREQAEQVVVQTLAEFGGLEILVNNAGVHHKAPFWEESEALWDLMYRTNVLGQVWPAQVAVRYMKEHDGGVIVNIASKAGVVGEPGHTAYSASKGAVISMTRSMAIELAPFQIRVNAISPGPVYTDMLLAAEPTEEGRQKLAADTPLGRIGKPKDVAEAAVYLASAESDWCTGQIISLDGGLSILK